jgi:hypothetical protein
MKCGREIPAGQVFCEECLAEMAEYPVKPGTVVTLPPRPKQVGAKKTVPHRAAVTLEQQVKKQGKTIRALSWCLTLSTALLIAVTALTVSLLTEETNQVLPGQNYSAEGETKDPPGWNIDRTDIYSTTEATSEATTPNYPGINGLGGN